MIIHMILYSWKNILLHIVCYSAFFQEFVAPSLGIVCRYGPMYETECVLLTMGCEKTTTDAIKFSYHFLLSDDQPGLSTKIFRILHKLDEDKHLNSSCRSQS